MVHKFSDRADEQRKEAEVVRFRTPPRNILIDLMTGQFCDPEPIEHGGQVIPFTAPRNPATEFTLDLLDEFLLDGLRKGWSPRLFLDNVNKMKRLPEKQE